MGYGTWSCAAYSTYSSGMGRSVSSDGYLDGDFTAQSMFSQHGLAKELNPYRVAIRESRDSDEHPNSLPVILALDVTGSMGQTAVEVAKSLNTIMTDILDTHKDVQFMIMGIGDLAYDRAPLQVSQFESDIRIAEQLDKIYFEGGGGGNDWESYTQAWWFAAYHTDCDCWKHGRKGILITLGDEFLNPHLDHDALNYFTGTVGQESLETSELYKEVSKKYDVYHIAIPTHAYNFHAYNWFSDGEGVNDEVQEKWCKVIPEDHYAVSTVNELAAQITNIVTNASNGSASTISMGDEISW